MNYVVIHFILHMNYVVTKISSSDLHLYKIMFYLTFLCYDYNPISIDYCQ